MKSVSDVILLKIYNQGWHTCASNNNLSKNYKGIQKRAYQLGWDHYLIGDEVKSVDALPKEQILKLIKT